MDFLVFETCSFNREWYDFEIQELSRSIKNTISYLNTYWYKKIAEKDLYLRDVFKWSLHLYIVKRNSPKDQYQRFFDYVGQQLKLEKNIFYSSE